MVLVVMVVVVVVLLVGVGVVAGVVQQLSVGGLYTHGCGARSRQWVVSQN